MESSLTVGDVDVSQVWSQSLTVGDVDVSQVGSHHLQLGMLMSGQVGSHHLQLGMLIPAGIPLLPKVSTSREVKSGRRNTSFSKAAGQGSRGRKCSA